MSTDIDKDFETVGIAPLHPAAFEALERIKDAFVFCQSLHEKREAALREKEAELARAEAVIVTVVYARDNDVTLGEARKRVEEVMSKQT